MNWFFTKKSVPIESDTESESENHSIFNRPILQKNNFSCYFISSIYFARYLQTWCYNRKINEDHKNKIKKELLEQKDPHLMGTIQIVRDKNQQARIINGQHRLKAIQEIIGEDIDNNFEIHCLFEVYDVDILDLINPTETEQEHIIQLFKKANSSLYMTPEEENDVLCRKLVDLLSKDFIGIVDKETGSVHRPRIVKKDLYEQVKTCLSVHNIEHIVSRIKQINSDYKTMADQDFFGTSKPSIDRLKRRKKAEKLGFFLNCDDYCSVPEKWLKLI